MNPFIQVSHCGMDDETGTSSRIQNGAGATARARRGTDWWILPEIPYLAIDTLW